MELPDLQFIAASSPYRMDDRRILPLHPAGGNLAPPADFLVDADRRILARKYGKRADDQRSVDDILLLARKAHDGHDG